jgi:hypothetical protein
MKFKLSLTTEDGVLLAQWILGDAWKDDYPAPLMESSAQFLRSEINDEINRYEKEHPSGH